MWIQCFDWIAISCRAVPWNVAIGDVNHDGVLDLVLAPTVHGSMMQKGLRSGSCLVMAAEVSDPKSVANKQCVRNRRANVEPLAMETAPRTIPSWNGKRKMVNLDAGTEDAARCRIIRYRDASERKRTPHSLKPLIFASVRIPGWTVATRKQPPMGTA
jgi:hypothetical protein